MFVKKLYCLRYLPHMLLWRLAQHRCCKGLGVGSSGLLVRPGGFGGPRRVLQLVRSVQVVQVMLERPRHFSTFCCCLVFRPFLVVRRFPIPFLESFPSS
jgi:hypothetical protein